MDGGWKLEEEPGLGARKHKWMVRPNSQGSYVSYPLMYNKSLQSLATLYDKHLLFHSFSESEIGVRFHWVPLAQVVV